MACAYIRLHSSETESLHTLKSHEPLGIKLLSKTVMLKLRSAPEGSDNISLMNVWSSLAVSTALRTSLIGALTSANLKQTEICRMPAGV